MLSESMTESEARRRIAQFVSWKAIVLLALLFAAFMAAGAVYILPPVRATGAAGFDAAAARARLQRILRDEAAHPVDSAREDETRAALLREIEALGYQPMVRDGFTCRAEARGPLIACARVRNIIFSAGPTEGPAVLAATHYDSVPAGPGASDAGVGVAAWLEIAKEIAHDRLTRRVIFLITDGEEAGLLGANEFLRRDPLMQPVQAIINLEARGTRGPAIFFETAEPNGDAVSAYARVNRPVANSIMADAYRLLPNSTDVSVLSRPGLEVVNIALLDGLENYHTPHDSIAHADLRSLQHMGDAALNLTRTMAGADGRGSGASRVYTDLGARAFISAPRWAGQAALAFGLLAAAFAFWRGGAQARWRVLFAPLGGIVVAGIIAGLFAVALGLVRAGEDYWFAHPAPTRAWCILLGLTGVVLGAAFNGGASAKQAGAAAMIWFALLGLLASFALPGISILFALPALAYALAVVIGFAWAPALALGAVLAGVLAVIVWAPALYLTELALGFEFPYVTTALIALACTPWLGAVAQLQSGAWRGQALALAGGAFAAVVVAALTPAASIERPAPLNLLRFFNTATGETRLLAGSARRPLPAALADGFAFRSELVLPGDKIPYWAAPLDVAAVPAATLRELTARQEGSERVIAARIETNGAYRVILRIPRSAKPLRVRINGGDASIADAGAQTDYINVACQGRACEGAEVVVTTDASGGTEDWYVIGQTPGAVEGLEPAIAARPSTAIPIQFGDGTTTLATLPLTER